MRVKFLSHRLVLHRQISVVYRTLELPGAATRGCSYALLQAGSCQGCGVLRGQGTAFARGTGRGFPSSPAQSPALRQVPGKGVLQTSGLGH